MEIGGLGSQTKFEAPGPSGVGNGEQDEASKQRQEAESAARYGRAEEIFESQIRNNDKPGEILEGVRSILEMSKDSNTTESIEDPWGIRNVAKSIYHKRLAMKMSPEKLTERGWIKGYDEKTGMATLLDRKAAGFAIKFNEIPEWQVFEKHTETSNGQTKDIETKRLGSKFEYKFGTLDERKKMERALERIYLEMGSDTTIGAYLGNQSKNRDALDYLTANAYGRLPHFTIDQTRNMLNRPDVNKFTENAEDNTVGKQDEVAMWWYLAMMSCETKAGLIDFLDGPATDALVMPGVSKEDRTRFLKTMFGDYDKWDDAGRTAKTLAEEVNANKRGPISIYGNIPARGRGENFDFDYNKEVEFIKLIGSMPGTSIDSSWYAATVLRVYSEFAINGAVLFTDTAPKGTPPKDVVRTSGGADIFLQANDEFKFNIEPYQRKEYASGRVFGPADDIGKIPQMALPYLDHAQIRVGYKTLPNGEKVPVTLPMRLAWLGDKARTVVDRATGKNVNVAAIPYTPLGKLDFGTLPRGDFEAFTQMHALAAREGWVYEMVTDNEPKPEAYLEKGLRTMRKRFSIIYNSLIVHKGDTRGQSNPGATATIVAQDAMDELLSARMQSQSFFLNVASKDLEVFDPGPAGGQKNRNPISMRGLFVATARKLGMFRGSSFDPNDQFLNDKTVIRKIPKTKGGIFGFGDE